MATAAAPQTPNDFVSTYTSILLDRIAGEIETNKKVIAAIPENGKDYRPDPKARTAHELAWHIADVDVNFLRAIADLDFSGMTSSDTTEEQRRPATIKEIVSWYDKNFQEQLRRIRSMSPVQLSKKLDFYGVFNHQAYQYLDFLLVHTVHHRGQLSVYLRPIGSKVPSIYGGSADEPFQPPK